MTRQTRLYVLLTFILPALSACKRSNDSMNFRHNKDGKGTPVATWTDDSVTVEELKQKFSEMSPFIRSRYATVEQRKEYVEGLTRFELLAAEAHKRGLQNEPEVVDAAKKMMVQKLIQKELDEKKPPVTDAEIAEYYEKHKSDYVKPETTRLSNIFFAASDPAAKSKKKALAEEVLGKAKGKAPTDSAGFIALVREYSEDPKTKPLEGDMRFLTSDELKNQYGAEVASAAAGLSKLGDLSPVVETPQGFHILRFQGRQAAINHTLEQVKTQIQSRIGFDRRTQNFNAFVQKLREQSGYKLNEANLGKVEVDLTPPTQPNQPPGAPPMSPVASQPGAPPSTRPASAAPPPASTAPATPAKPGAQPGTKPGGPSSAKQTSGH